MNASSRWGAAARGAWSLDPARAYLNHGGFGVTPNAVVAEQDRWRARIERDPSQFLTFDIDDALGAAIVPVAAAIGAAAADLVFVENATSGLNAVLRCLDFEPGDEILITGLTYPAIRKAAHYTASRSGARVVEVEIPLPIADERAIARAVAAKLGIRTKLAIFDHIASHSSLVLPAAELVRLGHEAGAKVMIDGAHAPGMIALDVPATGADWYVGNLHKWYFAPRSCGVLWASPAMQALTHPLAISHGYGAGFRTEFAWTGTRDATPALAAPASIAFHRELGGEALMTRNTALARDAAAMLAQRWRTGLTGPLACFAAMATVRLPIADEPSGTRANALMRELSERHGIAAAVFALGDALWVRVAAQAYNEMADYERLAALFAPPP